VKCRYPECDAKATRRNACERHYRAEMRAEKIKTANFCGCGCGERTLYTFVWGHHTRLFSNEEQARRGRQNTGASMRDRGAGKSYRKVGRRHEHRRVMENLIGRPLRSDEIVHHRNGDKRDNRPENLQLMTRREHILEHLPAMREAANAKRKTTI